MLKLQQITHSFDHEPVLQGIDLDVDQGEILCLLGPSGCGKTTLLRVIAGLERRDAGDILVNGESIIDAPVHRRGFGLMFQDYALFPHMTVADNILFGLRMQRMPAAQQHTRLNEVMELVGLAGFEQRNVTELSGGERQRVALARSLAPNPRLLMLDEPLGSLDASLREALVVELREIIKRAGLTALYVTHDQHEAFAIADRIAIMRDGIIEQIGTPESLYSRPETAFVARFLGLDNIVPVTDHTGNEAITPFGTFSAPQDTEAMLLHRDGLALSSPADSGSRIAGIVSARTFMGSGYQIKLDCLSDPAISLTCLIPAVSSSVPNIGDKVELSLRADKVLPLRNV